MLRGKFRRKQKGHPVTWQTRGCRHDRPWWAWRPEGGNFNQCPLYPGFCVLRGGVKTKVFLNYVCLGVLVWGILAHMLCTSWRYDWWFCFTLWTFRSCEWHFLIARIYSCLHRFLQCEWSSWLAHLSTIIGILCWQAWYGCESLWPKNF